MSIGSLRIQTSSHVTCTTANIASHTVEYRIREMHGNHCCSKQVGSLKRISPASATNGTAVKEDYRNFFTSTARYRQQIRLYTINI